MSARSWWRCAREDLEWVRELLRAGVPGKPVRVVEGGDSRQQSVENALATLGPDTDLVAVHDAVRPFIDLETIEKVIDEAAETGAAIVGIVPVDTVKQVTRGTSNVRIRATLPREQLVLAQTPQVFRYDLLKRAFASAREDGFTGTDESSLVERLDSGSQRGAGQRPQHQDHQAHRHGPGAPVPATRKRRRSAQS